MNGHGLGCMEVVRFHSVLWAAVGRFMIGDSGSVGVILIMVLDLPGTHGSGLDDCYGKQLVSTLIPS